MQTLRLLRHPLCCGQASPSVLRQLAGGRQSGIMRVLAPAQENVPAEEPPVKRSCPSPAVEPLRVKRLGPDATLPVRGSAGAAGYDLSSAEDTEVPAHGKALISTQLAVAVPPGTYGRVAPRSGLAWKHFIDTGAGVIDADYRGELKVLLYNHSDVAFTVSKGDRVAQLVLERIITPEVVDVEDLADTDRGAGGFGSTGIGKQ